MNAERRRGWWNKAASRKRRKQREREEREARQREGWKRDPRRFRVRRQPMPGFEEVRP